MLISAYKVLLNKHNSTQQMKLLLRKHGTKIQTPEGEMNRSVENFLYENTVMNSFVSITYEVILSYQLTGSVLSHCFASNPIYKCFKTLDSSVQIVNVLGRLLELSFLMETWKRWTSAFFSNCSSPVSE